MKHNVAELGLFAWYSAISVISFTNPPQHRLPVSIALPSQTFSISRIRACSTAGYLFRCSVIFSYLVLILFFMPVKLTCRSLNERQCDAVANLTACLSVCLSVCLTLSHDIWYSWVSQCSQCLTVLPNSRPIVWTAERSVSRHLKPVLTALYSVTLAPRSRPLRLTVHVLSIAWTNLNDVWHVTMPFCSVLLTLYWSQL